MHHSRSSTIDLSISTNPANHSFRRSSYRRRLHRLLGHPTASNDENERIIMCIYVCHSYEKCGHNHEYWYKFHAGRDGKPRKEQCPKYLLISGPTIPWYCKLCQHEYETNHQNRLQELKEDMRKRRLRRHATCTAQHGLLTGGELWLEYSFGFVQGSQQEFC